ncbi:hypothetical protein [Aggregatibacter actinomycetemcomitans]|uniref:hypothetical protein n=1 Tax=Aggregatibacter actinomycetemcomitans TaxID=714 RepID=UPI001F11A859|nr:hypothetical protein [Aggregatibacter actinomycetemcomitans]
MKKTALFAAAALMLAACNTASTPTQSTQNPAWNTQYGGADKSYDTTAACLTCASKSPRVLKF